MKILITGANGLIGRKVIRLLLQDSNNQVYATSQKRIQFDSNVQFFTVNLIYSDINKLIETIKPDVLFHCAAIASPDACEVDRYTCFKLNVEVTTRLASSCRDYGVHLIFLSSDFIFDGNKGDYTEEDLPAPISYYGETKLEAEKNLLDLNIGATIVRTSLVYGYEDHLARMNVALKVIDHLKNSKTYKVPFDQIRTPTFAEDLASALVRLAEKRLAGVYNVSGSEGVSVFDFSKRIANAFGLDERLLIPVSTKELSEPALRPLKTNLNIQKVIKEINFQPTTIDNSLNILKDQLKI